MGIWIGALCAISGVRFFWGVLACFARKELCQSEDISAERLFSWYTGVGGFVLESFLFFHLFTLATTNCMNIYEYVQYVSGPVEPTLHTHHSSYLFPSAVIIMTLAVE